MTVYDYDRRQTTCPACGETRLVFIVTAPRLWPVGDDLRYRCKTCATDEANASGDPLTVFSHQERTHLARAWADDRPLMPKRPIRDLLGSKAMARQADSDASSVEVVT